MNIHDQKIVISVLLIREPVTFDKGFVCTTSKTSPICARVLQKLLNLAFFFLYLATIKLYDFHNFS